MFEDLQSILSGNQAIPVEVNADDAIAKIKKLAIPAFIGLFLVIVLAVLLANTISSRI